MRHRAQHDQLPEPDRADDAVDPAPAPPGDQETEPLPGLLDDAQVEEIDHRIERRHRRRWLAGVVGVLLVLAYVGWQQYTDHQRTTGQDRLTAQVRGLSTAVDTARKQIEQLGASPSVPPASKIQQHPDTPIPTPTAVGPSDAQVQAAVDAFCEQPQQPCRAPDTPPAQVYAAVANFLKQHPPAAGPAGPGPTADQMYAALVKYCSQDSAPCRGPAGEKGDKGDKGDTGAQGPGPTDDQLAAAVRQYLTDNPPPTCPADTTATAETVLTAAGPVDAVICVRNSGG